jgi:hypothetical protein
LLHPREPLVLVCMDAKGWRGLSGKRDVGVGLVLQ